MTLYRTVELTPGVRLEPAPGGRAAVLVIDYDAGDDELRHARAELDEPSLDRLVEAILEAIE